MIFSSSSEVDKVHSGLLASLASVGSFVEELKLDVANLAKELDLFVDHATTLQSLDIDRRLRAELNKISLRFEEIRAKLEVLNYNQAQLDYALSIAVTKMEDLLGFAANSCYTS